MTGLGDRSHLLDSSIGLYTHVRDLEAVFEYEDLSDAVLVAHSYGGMVATAAMESIGERVRGLVYLDAHMPREGESMMDLVDPSTALAFTDLVGAEGEGWYVPCSDASYWGITDPDDLAWVNHRITPQPMRTYTDAIGPTKRAWEHPGMFVECRTDAPAVVPLDRPRARAAADPRFAYRVLAGPHDAMISAPDAVCAILLDALGS